MAKLSRVRTDGTLIDPFCGSGTILIEGAMLAMHIAPGLRRHFAAEKWKAVPGNIWDNELHCRKGDLNVAMRAFWRSAMTWIQKPCA